MPTNNSRRVATTLYTALYPRFYLWTVIKYLRSLSTNSLWFSVRFNCLIRPYTFSICGFRHILQIKNWKNIDMKVNLATFMLNYRFDIYLFSMNLWNKLRKYLPNSWIKEYFWFEWQPWFMFNSQVPPIIETRFFCYQRRGTVI